MSKSKEYIESESFVVVNPNFPVIGNRSVFYQSWQSNGY